MFYNNYNFSDKLDNLKKLNTADLRHWLALSQIKHFGIKSLLYVLDHIDELGELFSARTHRLAAMKFNSTQISQIKKLDWALVDEAMRWQEEEKHHILVFTDEQYPVLLKEIASPPLLLYVDGDVDVLSTEQIAIVGSRSSRHSALETAQRFASELASNGLTITSGLALGIDTQAHQGALLAEQKTIAVLGTGVNRIYPARNHKLAAKIRENGTIVSEFPLNTAPQPSNFPRRNRIISGLSGGVLVIEAAMQSGSLITARYAMEQNREVFALPGSVHNPLARGCHALLRDGATLVETVEDILSQLPNTLLQQNHSISMPNSDNMPSNDENVDKLLANFDAEVVSIDQLIQRSGLTAQQVSAILSLLELQDRVVSAPGGYLKTL